MASTDDIADVYARSDALGLADLVRRRDVSSAELVEAAIARIERIDPALNAVVIRTFEKARDQVENWMVRVAAAASSAAFPSC